MRGACLTIAAVVKRMRTLDNFAQEAAARADKLCDVLACLRTQLGILDDLGQHAVAARLSQALDFLEGDVALLQAERENGGDRG
jgi:hypothetical protein